VISPDANALAAFVAAWQAAGLDAHVAGGLWREPVPQAQPLPYARVMSRAGPTPPYYQAPRSPGEPYLDHRQLTLEVRCAAGQVDALVAQVLAAFDGIDLTLPAGEFTSWRPLPEETSAETTRQDGADVWRGTFAWELGQTLPIGG
jgi:hypothetical protein